MQFDTVAEERAVPSRGRPLESENITITVMSAGRRTLGLDRIRVTRKSPVREIAYLIKNGHSNEGQQALGGIHDQLETEDRAESFVTRPENSGVSHGVHAEGDGVIQVFQGNWSVRFGCKKYRGRVEAIRVIFLIVCGHLTRKHWR